MSQIADERPMTITDLSTMLGVPIAALCGWRHRGEGPIGYRIGAALAIGAPASRAWLEQQANRRRSSWE
jgi:hypothetical protein